MGNDDEAILVLLQEGDPDLGMTIFVDATDPPASDSIGPAASSITSPCSSREDRVAYVHNPSNVSHSSMPRTKLGWELIVKPFSMVSTDIIGPLLKAYCRGRYVVHFTWMSSKWSWCKELIKKHDLGDAFKESSALNDSMNGTVTMMPSAARTMVFLYPFRHRTSRR